MPSGRPGALILATWGTLSNFPLTFLGLEFWPRLLRVLGVHQVEKRLEIGRFSRYVGASFAIRRNRAKCNPSVAKTTISRFGEPPMSHFFAHFLGCCFKAVPGGSQTSLCVPFWLPFRSRCRSFVGLVLRFGGRMRVLFFRNF